MLYSLPKRQGTYFAVKIAYLLEQCGKYRPSLRQELRNRRKFFSRGNGTQKIVVVVVHL